MRCTAIAIVPHHVKQPGVGAEIMPMTKSELMYFMAGVAVGGTIGANWSKIKPMLDPFLGPAAAGFGDAYGDIARALAEQVESAQDAAAQRRHQANGSKKKRKKQKTHKKHAGEMHPDSTFAMN
jgi:hypothetical protein